MSREVIERDGENSHQSGQLAPNRLGELRTSILARCGIEKSIISISIGIWREAQIDVRNNGLGPDSLR